MNNIFTEIGSYQCGWNCLKAERLFKKIYILYYYILFILKVSAWSKECRFFQATLVRGIWQYPL